MIKIKQGYNKRQGGRERERQANRQTDKVLQDLTKDKKITKGKKINVLLSSTNSKRHFMEHWKKAVISSKNIFAGL